MASKRAQRRKAERQGTLRQFRHAQHACGNKERFKSEELAGIRLESLMNASYFDGGPMNVYLCPISGDHYHYGHIPPRMAYA